MGFDEGRIVLDNAVGCYYAGQTVYGKLIFDQDKPKKFRKIYAHMKGYCKVHWTTTRTERNANRTVVHRIPHDSYEEYFDREISLLENNRGEYHLEPGHHEIPFECVLPFNCPSSFEGSHGFIRYEIKIIVDRSFKFDQEKKVVLRVFSLKDLNLDPYAKEPIAMEFNESYCCCCMGSGKCQTLVKLPVAGYCPGQVIPVELSCTNSSSVEIDKIKFKVKREVAFHAHTNPGTKKEEETLLEIKRGPVPANTTRNWSFDIEVPAIDVCNVSSCRFIDIEHEFTVKVVAEGCHENSHGSRRIVLGNIPIRGFQDNVENPLSSQMPTSLPIVNQPVSSHSSPYPGGPQFPGGNQPLVSPYPPANSPYAPINSPHPSANSPYPPAKSPYPPANSPHPPANSPYPPANPHTISPYPPAKSPYPPENSPYPPANSPYPPANSPYPPANPPTNSPYPPSNSPFPPINSPYPPANSPRPIEKSPYPGVNPPNPTVSSPYPPTVSPCPGMAQPYPPVNQANSADDLPPPYPGLSPAPASYPTANQTIEKSPIGFDKGVMPSLPPGASVPCPSPYASASAPEPATPSSDTMKPSSDPSTDAPPAFNPAFVKQEDKNE